MICKNNEMAELTGIVLGDGSFYSNGDVYQLDIAFNSDDKHYIEYVMGIIRQITKSDIYRKQERNANCEHIRLCKKNDVIEIMKLMEMKFGNKITNNSKIPDWIWKNHEYLKYCVRGLIDTDGSIYYLKPNWPNLSQLSFKNNNKHLLFDTRQALIELGYSPSKIFGNRFVLTKQEQIKRYYNEIGSRRIQPRSLVAKN